METAASTEKKTAKSSGKKTKKEPTLEQILQQLDELTSQMEQQDLPLDQMMSLYKQGKELEKKARQLLDQSQKELEILSAGEDIPGSTSLGENEDG